MDVNRLNIIENYKNPSNFGKPENFTHSASISNLSCGDEIVVYLSISQNIISNIQFEGSGCSISIATMSMLTDLLLNQNKSILKTINLDFIQSELLKTQISSGRYKCATIGIEAINKSLSQSTVHDETVE